MAKVELPALNWFISVLVENCGGNDWVPKTQEELEQFKKETGSDYPYKVVKHPIPPGNVILLEKGKYRIECDSEYTRELIIELAKKHLALEKEHYRLLKEKRSEVWHPASDVPDPSHSSVRRRRVLVTSPALQYVVSGGVCEGYEDDGWYVVIAGKAIRHDVSHWRHLPPAAEEAPPYEEIKGEAERLRKAITKDGD